MLPRRRISISREMPPAHQPERIEAASALAGFLQCGAGFLAGVLLDWMLDGTPAAMATLMAAFALLAVAFLRLQARSAD